MMVDEPYSDSYSNGLNQKPSTKAEKLEYVEGNPLLRNLKNKATTPKSSTTSSSTVPPKTDNSSSTKHENLSHAIPISDEEIKALIKELDTTEDNQIKLTIIETKKEPYLFSSSQLLTILNSLTSVKTRLSIISEIGPRLIDPKDNSDDLVNLFRFADEKEKVEEILKARSTTLSSSMFVKTGQRNALSSRHPSRPNSMQSRPGSVSRPSRNTLSDINLHAMTDETSMAPVAEPVVTADTADTETAGKGHGHTNVTFLDDNEVKVNLRTSRTRTLDGTVTAPPLSPSLANIRVAANLRASPRTRDDIGNCLSISNQIRDEVSAATILNASPSPRKLTGPASHVAAVSNNTATVTPPIPPVKPLKSVVRPTSANSGTTSPVTLPVTSTTTSTKSVTTKSSEKSSSPLKMRKVSASPSTVHSDTTHTGTSSSSTSASPHNQPHSVSCTSEDTTHDRDIHKTITGEPPVLTRARVSVQNSSAEPPVPIPLPLPTRPSKLTKTSSANKAKLLEKNLAQLNTKITSAFSVLSTNSNSQNTNTDSSSSSSAGGSSANTQPKHS